MKQEICPHCDELRRDVQIDYSYQQWHCGCCGSWNDRPQEEIDADNSLHQQWARGADQF